MDVAELKRRYPRAHLHLLDAAAAAAVTAAYLGFAAGGHGDGQPGFTGPAWLGWLVAAAVGPPLAVRRRLPVTVLAVVTAGGVAALLLDLTREPLLPVAFALYSVGARTHADPSGGVARRTPSPALPFAGSAAVAAATVLVCGGAVLLGQAVLTPSEPVRTAAGFAAVVVLVQAGGWWAGVVAARRRAAAGVRSERVAEAARQAERLRIARELHDLVSHHLGMIAVKAGIANHLSASHPGEAAEALRVIESTSRGALAEMRSMLDVLRTGAASEPGRGPAPGLAGLSELTNRARRTGTAVELDVRGDARVPDGVGLAVHRIVQEALTNVAKHAGAARCAVTVELGERQVSVEVSDDGAGAPGPPIAGGYGLIGMRERVMLYRGDFTAGPRADGGYTVSARIPFEPVQEAA